MMNFLKEIGKNSGYEGDINPKTGEDIKSLINAFSGLIAGGFNKSRINCFNTLSKANAYIEEGKDNNEFDPDKAIRLLKISSDFSSEDMQDLIARIIAGEYNSPGRFSLKTIDIVHSLSRDDILLFKKFCGLVFGGELYFYDFFKSGDSSIPLLRELGMGYEKLLHLQELGLVSPIKDIETEIGEETEKGKIKKHGIFIQDQEIIIAGKGFCNLGGLGKLTLAGKELFSLIGFESNQKLIDITVEKYKEYINK